MRQKKIRVAMWFQLVAIVGLLILGVGQFLLDGKNNYLAFGMAFLIGATLAPEIPGRKLRRTVQLGLTWLAIVMVAIEIYLWWIAEST